jgi:hypothetical protein
MIRVYYLSQNTRGPRNMRMYGDVHVPMSIYTHACMHQNCEHHLQNTLESDHMCMYADMHVSMSLLHACMHQTVRIICRTH